MDHLRVARLHVSMALYLERSVLMAADCRAGQYWDALIKDCMHCHMECKRPHVIPRCTSYCVSVDCEALPGHYYDRLLKTCVSCSELCGRHPAECSQHCRTPPPPFPTERLPIDVTPHGPYSRVSTSLEEPTLLLYPLLALCLVLLFSSLTLALVVFLRGARAKTSNPRSKEADHNQGCEVQHGQKVVQPRCQQGQISKDFRTNSKQPTDCEPSDDSGPTETCVCVHCFPELKALNQDNDRPPRAPVSFYPQVVLHGARKGGPPWAEGETHTSGQELQEEAAMG